MAIFYTGPRPVIRGRNSNDNIHHWKNTEEVYSNWSLMNSSRALDGAPNSDHTIGTGRHPHGLFLSRRYRGLDTKNPLDGPGSGVRLANFRYRPLEFKGLTGNQVFSASFGHADRDSNFGAGPYSEDDLFTRLSNPGHAVRGVDGTGAAATFGRFDPLVYKGVTDQPLEGGQALPEGYDNDYGRNRINEWRGVTSAKALNV